MAPPSTWHGDAAPSQDVIVPRTSTKVLQGIFATEAVLNLLIAWPYVFNPLSAVRDQLMPSDAIPSTESSSLLQLIGMCTVTMNVPLICGVPSRPGAVEVRKAAYLTLMWLEVSWISVLLWQRSVGDAVTGLSSEKCLTSVILPMSVWLLFRLWVFLVKPHWFGTYAVKKD